ncbi:unnamed protein product [Umbelopsis ramanniana]
MSNSLHTPLQLDGIENASQEKTPDDWFRSPTVKTLKRRQLQLGEANDDQFPSWFAHGAQAQTVFDRPASSIQIFLQYRNRLPLIRLPCLIYTYATSQHKSLKLAAAEPQ